MVLLHKFFFTQTKNYMNKSILTLIVAGCSMSAIAQNVNPANGEQVCLTSSLVDPYGGMGLGRPKSPVQPPYVTLDDHTLYIWSQHGGYTLTLLDENDTVVYQTYVAAGVQFADLPSTLSGSYTLQLSNDTYLFTGVIDLE